MPPNYFSVGNATSRVTPNSNFGVGGASALTSNIGNTNLPNLVGNRAKSPQQTAKTPVNTLPASQVIKKPAPVPVPAPPTNNQAKIATDTSQLADLQKQAGALKQYNLNDTNQLTKDATGNYVPIQANNPPPPASAGGSNGSSTASSGSGSTNGTADTQTANVGQNSPASFQGQTAPPAGAGTFQQNVGTLDSIYNNPSPAVQQAIQQLKGVQDEAATAFANTEGQPITAGSQQGQQGILQRLYQTKIANAQAQVQNSLQEQQQGIGALEAGTGAIQPTPANALGFYNPATGNTTGYNAPGGAFGAGEVTGQVQQGQQYQTTLAPALNAAQSVLNGNQDAQGNGNPGLLKFLKDNPGINPSVYNLGNKLAAWVLGNQISDPHYPVLTQYLNEFLGSLAPIVGASGDATDFKQSLVNDMVNSSSANTSLSQQLQSMLSNAQLKAQSLFSSGQSAQGSPGDSSGKTTMAYGTVAGK